MTVESAPHRPPLGPSARAAAWARRSLLTPVTPRRQRWGYALVATLGAGLWALYATRLGAPVFPVDDAYITLHNALALRDGHDPNFAGVSSLIGATSSVHLALVALLCVPLSPLVALQTAGWIAAIAYALGLLRMAFVHRACALQAAVLVLVGLLVGRTPHQLMNGLETGAAMAALVWTLNLASVREHRRYAAIACGVLPFLRPELAAFSLPCAAVIAYERWGEATDRREGARAAAETLGLAFAGALPWLVWYRAATGAFVPTTVAAKRAFFAESCLPPDVRERWVRGGIEQFTGIVGLLTRALLLCAITPLGRAGIVLAAAIAVAYYQRFPGALGHYENRYLYVLLPVMLHGAAACFSLRSVFLRGAATMLLALSLEQSIDGARERWQQYLNNRAFTAGELEGVADFCRRQLPPGARLLIHDAGYISWATPFALVDMVGLKTPGSWAHHQSLTLPTCGRRRGDAVHEIALRERPDHLVVLRGWDGIYRLSDSLRSHGWTLTPLRPPTAAYEVYRLAPPP